MFFSKQLNYHIDYHSKNECKNILSKHDDDNNNYGVRKHRKVLNTINRVVKTIT